MRNYDQACVVCREIITLIIGWTIERSCECLWLDRTAMAAIRVNPTCATPYYLLEVQFEQISMLWKEFVGINEHCVLEFIEYFSMFGSRYLSN